MRDRRQTANSDLFLVRVWVRETDKGEREWRGKIQRAVSGEEYYFDDLPQLPDLLRSIIPGYDSRDEQLPDLSVME